MKPMTREWVRKAEGDFATLGRESRARKNPNYDAICFHAQQCAEKYLKAVLCENGVKFRPIHDLVTLLELALPLQPEWERFREDLAFLSGYAVSYRYPGEWAKRQSAMDALDRCRSFRLAARHILKLSS
jgi:HEPN domain-containing protein